MLNKLFKQLICAILALSVILGLAACGGGSMPDDSEPSAENVQSDGEAATSEIPVVKIALPSISEPTRKQQVTDAVNEILVEQIGCKVEFIPLDYGTYANQMNMILSSDENTVDAFHTMYSFTLSSLVANGQIMALDELVEKYGQGIVDAVGSDYIDCGRVNGDLYTLPIVAAYSTSLGYLMSKEVADEFGATDENINSLADLTELFMKVKEKYPEYNLVPTSSAGWMADSTIDNLCDTNNLGVLMNYGEELKVENYYASENYLEFCKYGKIWQDAGLLTDDPLNSNNGTMAEINNGTALGCFIDRYSAYAIIMDYQSMFNMEITAFTLSDAFATTQNVIHSNWCIPSSCKDPESTMKVLNEFYTNPEIATLLLLGIEGETYVTNENGQAVYADGVDMMNAGWGMGMTFFWLNSAISTPLAPQTTEYWEDVKNSNEVCKKSKALGFTFDSSAVVDEMTACANVVNQYHLPLLAGIVDYEEVLPQFLEALEAAGIDKIIAEKQRQLDEWAAAK